VTAPAQLDLGELVAAVETAGYTAALRPPPTPAGGVEPAGGAEPGGRSEAHPGPTEAEGLTALAATEARDRVLIQCGAECAGDLAGHGAAWQFDYWQWVSYVLTAPVVLWAGWRSTGPP